MSADPARRLYWFSENIHALSGYSDEGRILIAGLMKRGVDVRVLGRNRRPENRDFVFASKPERGIPVVFHTYRHGRYDPRIVRYSIVRTMLEVDRIPQSWVYRFRPMGEIWLPGGFMANVFKNSGVDPDRVFAIPSPVDVAEKGAECLDSVHERKFVFLTLFDWRVRHRKGLDLLVRAYCEEFRRGEDVEMVVKTNTTQEELRSLFPILDSSASIRVVNQTMERRRLLSLYRKAGCFVLPTRGEGIGRPFLDAMWTGTPIVATGWGGHTDFLTRDNSFPVKYRLVDVAPEFFLRYPGFYGARWAEPDVGDLKKQMRRVWKNRTLSAVRTRRALQDVQRFASSKVCEEILRRLNDPLELPGRTGQAANLFSRLFPVFFPGNPGGEEIRRLAEADFGRRIASVALAGQGPALHRAADCVTRVVGIKNVVFLKLEDGDDSPANLGSVKLQNFNPESHPVDAVILACYVERVADYYHTILNHTDTLPLYVFD